VVNLGKEDLENELGRAEKGDRKSEKGLKIEAPSNICSLKFDTSYSNSIN
jgi:hypothetical protein